METVNTPSIWERKAKIEAARRNEMVRVMGAYDKEVYYPALKALREECEVEGHNEAKWHDNGLGWGWWYCGKCGTSHGKKKLY